MKSPSLLSKANYTSDVTTVSSVKDLPYNSKSGSIVEVTNNGVKELKTNELLSSTFYILISSTSTGDIALSGDKVLTILNNLDATYYNLNNLKRTIHYNTVAILSLVYREYELLEDLLWKNLNNIKIFVINKNKTPYIYTGEKWEPMDYVQKSDFAFDNTPTEGSSSLLTSGVIYNELNNKADLVNGKVPSDLLPSYVDDVVEFPTFLDFPEIGESGKIYIDTNTNSCYRWSGSIYIEIQSPIELDEYPTLDSENAVLSGGVYSALLEKLDIISDLSEIRLGATLGATALLPEDISDKLNILTAGDGIAIDNSDTIRTTGIPFGICDNTSTATAFTATVPGIYKLEDGVCCLIKNGVITSKAGFTLNINGLGAKRCYNNMAAATAESTLFNINYTILFIYDSTRVEGGGWIYYRGYDSGNTNTVGYQLRGALAPLPVSDTARYYKLYFTSADGTMRVPASINSTNDATTIREVNQRPIDPFGLILYTSSTTNYTTGTNLAVATAWSQYAIVLGYSFNRTGAALLLTFPAPVYIKCASQADGSAIIDADTPYVQALPSTNDGKIYIFLGIAYSVTNVELLNNHPVYYHDGTGIRLWTGKDCYTKLEIDSVFTEIDIEDINELWNQLIIHS